VDGDAFCDVEVFRSEISSDSILFIDPFQLSLQNNNDDNNNNNNKVTLLIYQQSADAEQEALANLVIQ